MVLKEIGPIASLNMRQSRLDGQTRDILSNMCDLTEANTIPAGTAGRNPVLVTESITQIVE